ncbi:very short patch repair endonuclease [Herbiconiux sp. CPCC 205716]|uniref:Very short patch repair endonuclease n=1 Tax=Herbiconiux gentiana TaxID=2970912 RepID=A0ABT2GBF2_9MICO|nr:very short patch repair endonuclease [Herbiconiux gentiana]MCS5713529.1 very short patch repair endonuclease [Herbiconiux gentiana]
MAPSSASWASSPGALATMKANIRRDTKPELEMRRRLHALGYRYRVDHPLKETPRRRADLVFTRLKLAIFVDGCFWHGCPKHYISPRANSDYWIQKVERNRARDADTTARLTEAGWRVLRIWEHVPVEEGVSMVEATIESLRAGQPIR